MVQLIIILGIIICTYNTFVDSFLHAVACYADKPAIIFRGENITYDEVNQRANGIAQQLLINGVNPEQIIPLILDRDIQTIISILGVLKAGCAFLPISPITPCARIRFILEDTNANCVISNVKLDHVINQNIKVIRPAETESLNTEIRPFL